MATDRVLEGLRLTPDDVSEHEFAHGFRGYDVHEVRSFLRIVSGEMSRLTDLSGRDHLVTPASIPSASPPELSRERLVELVGDESAKVLRAAEDAAAEIRARAETNVEQMLKGASAEAAQLRSGGDQQRADAVETAEADLAAAKDKAAAIVAQAEVDAQKIRDAAVGEGRSMMAETTTAKENVLRDLARKRKSARRELAQLRAGIDQLHESYDELRSMLDTSSMVVDGAVDDARRAAANAAERFDRSDYEDDVREVTAMTEAAAVPAGDEVSVPVDTGVPDKGTLVDEEPGEIRAAVSTTDLHPGVDEIPSVADAAAARSDERRHILRRGQKIEPEGDVDSVSATVDDAVAATTDSGEVTGRAEEIDSITDTDDDDLTELQGLLDDVPVPPPAEPPPLFGRGDTNVDELFARIRNSREGAVAQAHRVLGGEEVGSVADIDEESIIVAEESDAPASAPTAIAVRDNAELFADVVLSVDEFRSDISRLLKRMLADRLNEVLDIIRRADSVGDVEEIIAADSAAEYGEAVRELLEQVALRGACNDGSQVDISLVIGAVSRDIGSSIRVRVEEQLTGEEGLDQRIRTAFREWRRERADEVAEAAVVSAFNLGVLSHLQEGAAVAWVRPDGRCVQPDCADNASSGDVVVGGLFPSGHATAPTGSGCRCLVVGSAK